MNYLRYLMLLKCLDAYNKRVDRESKHGQTQFIDKQGIKHAD